MTAAELLLEALKALPREDHDDFIEKLQEWSHNAVNDLCPVCLKRLCLGEQSHNDE